MLFTVSVTPDGYIPFYLKCPAGVYPDDLCQKFDALNEYNRLFTQYIILKDDIYNFISNLYRSAVKLTREEVIEKCDLFQKRIDQLSGQGFDLGEIQELIKY